MNEQELNKKLAEWMEQDKAVWLFWRNERTLEPIISQRPNFTQSLDACFKWLKPAVIAKSVDTGGILVWRRILKEWVKSMAEEKAMDDKPALALCLAIEKLIDNTPNELEPENLKFY